MLNWLVWVWDRLLGVESPALSSDSGYDEDKRSVSNADKGKYVKWVTLQMQGIRLPECNLTTIHRVQKREVFSPARLKECISPTKGLLCGKPFTTLKFSVERLPMVLQINNSRLASI